MNHRVAAVNHRPNRRSSLLASLFWMIHCCLCLFPFHNNNNMAQAQSIIIDTTIAAEAAATAAEVTAAATADYADFLVTSDRNNILNTDEHFVVRITDPAMIAEARAELDKFSGFKIISGFIEKTTADWNPRWSYHFTPSSIFFGDFFIEVCDASATYVEENLSAAGGSFLPRLQWWVSKFILPSLQCDRHEA